MCAVSFAGSVVGLKGNAGQCVYSASKSGLEGFTRSLAKEVASRDIRVNLVAPGRTRVLTPKVLCSTVLDSDLHPVLVGPFRFHSHRHDGWAEGGRRGAFHTAREIWRARGGGPSCVFPFTVALYHRTGAGGGWGTAAGHLGLQKDGRPALGLSGDTVGVNT